MRTQTLLIILSLSIQGVWGQNLEGVVRGEDGEGLPFVNIVVNEGERGTTTDLQGRFSLENASTIRQVKFSFVGYEAKTLEGNELSSPLKITLIEKTEALDEVKVFPGENPAHRIINNAIANRSLNDPEELEEFQYLSYSKFWVGMNPDSVETSIDTAQAQQIADEQRQADELNSEKEDSSSFDFKEFISKQHLFFMETVTQRNFTGSRDNEQVLAQRTSGFKNPIFALLVTQMQSFSFYGDFIGIGGGSFVNPISNGSTRRYYFLLQDTAYHPSGDTTFYISFRPRPNKGFEALKGVLAIESSDWAIRNVRAEPATETDMPTTIRQEYQKFGEHTWFPISFEADILMKTVNLNGATPKAVMNRKLFDINLEPEINSSDISRALITIDENSSTQADTVLDKYRPEKLNAKESTTYQTIDSIGEEFNFDRHLESWTFLTQGYIPYKFLNFDLGQLYNYNVYEGHRLGLGLRTNSRLSEHLELGGYFAYGFGDEVWKYGLDTEIELDQNSSFQLRGGYFFDIFETGGFDIPTYEAPSISEDNYRRLWTEQWDESERYFAGFSIDPIPTLSIDARFRHEARRTVGNYRFSPPDQNGRGETFRYSEAITTLRYAPREEYAELPTRKIRLSGGTPVVFLSYTRGFPNVFGSDFAFDKLQLRSSYYKRWVRWGTTSLSLNGGVVFQDLPAQRLFAGSANSRNISDFWERNLETTADRNSFETMRFNEFLSDSYVELFFRHDFRSNLLALGKFRPHIEVVNRMAFGQLRNADRHQNIGTKSLEDGFFESGIELNRLYSQSFMGLGLGFYYRYGSNRLSGFENNFAFKLTSKFSL